MTRAVLFWILMLLWLIFGMWFYWPAAGVGGIGYAGLGVPLIIFILFVVLGWQVFGSPVKG